jgi:hypothetical protein
VSKVLEKSHVVKLNFSEDINMEMEHICQLCKKGLSLMGVAFEIIFLAKSI